jgi:hypothetical protein
MSWRLTTVQGLIEPVKPVTFVYLRIGTTRFRWMWYGVDGVAGG